MWILLLFLIFILLLFIPNSNFVHKVFKIISLTWMGVLILSELNFSDMYEVDSFVYLYFLIFFIFYFLGFWLKKYNKFENNNFEVILDQAKSINESKTFNVISILYIILISYYFLQYLIIYSAIEDVAAVRTSRFEVGGMFKNGYSVALYNYVVSSGIWVYKFLLCFSVVFGVAKYKKLFVYSIISCALYYFIGAGRILIIEIIFIYLYLYFLNRHFFSVKSYFKNIVFLSLAIFLFVLGTYVRLNNEKMTLELFLNLLNESLKQSVIYITGSFRAFNYAVLNYDHLLYGYGIFTLSAIEVLFFNVFAVLGFDVEPHLYTWGQLLADPIYIGERQEFNALYTGLFNFYFDFGLGGIAFWGMILGFLTSYSLNIFIKNKGNIWNLFISVCFFMISIFMFMSFKLNASLFLIMVFSYFYLRKKI